MSDTSSTLPAQNTSVNTKLAVNLQSLLDDLFLVLTEKEAMVIKRRFALQGQPKQTLEKIGKHFKVTRERIRQIEAKALEKIQKHEGIQKLRDY